MKAIVALLLLVVAGLVGCAAPSGSDSDAEEGSGESNEGESNEAQSRGSNADPAAAFAVDYGVSGSAAGILVASGTFASIDDRDLAGALPEGDASAAAQCLAARKDSVHGDTLEGRTWTFNHRTYYVLVVGLDDMKGLTDLHMVFVFDAKGAAAFQALTWDGKKNVKLTSGRSACP